MELWKEIQDYEGVYEVSNLGRVRSSKNKTTQSVLHGERKWKQRVLKSKTDKKGYKRVTLYKSKVSKDYLVHRLVAAAFINKVDGKDFVNHKDGNPSNNYADNLEWCNYKENLRHAYENRLNKSPDPLVLLNTNTLDVKYFYSNAEASRYLGRSDGYVNGLLNRGVREIDEYEIFTKGSKELTR